MSPSRLVPGGFLCGATLSVEAFSIVANMLVDTQRAVRLIM
ncbi:hypothetical protein NBRC3257_2766 [Gluconobacter thailandicus NBRC 3257]|uniref:Uncharacterized protein n=1 Tax=Gluconobacter thailandicus NBRC 3257 TaxID=1381097 RepID=A0ABQ0IZZ2_GLUTH|nr:hypothetical protein NBRC3255_2278 [Gluconobacter thailandicus NBRC 3255]GAD27767.1 hypothetical protein NBRC3257_2766 [Gluconobacter thailandicus NBRC 3257]